MTPDQMQIVERVVNRVYHKYIFGFYEPEDIKQEAFIFAIEAMDRYDGERPLENFLTVHVANRLKNFKRNNYYRLGVTQDNAKRYNSNESKKKLMEPAELFDFDYAENEDLFEKMHNKDIMAKLMDAMPPIIKSDFQRLANGVKITKTRKANVFSFVKELLSNEEW